MSQTRTRYNITPEQFVTAWTLSNSTNEVAQKLNCPKSVVLSRSASYRKAGVNLKKMPRPSSPKLNIEKLNATATATAAASIADSFKKIVTEALEPAETAAA